MQGHSYLWCLLKPMCSHRKPVPVITNLAFLLWGSHSHDNLDWCRDFFNPGKKGKWGKRTCSEPSRATGMNGVHINLTPCLLWWKQALKHRRRLTTLPLLLSEGRASARHHSGLPYVCTVLERAGLYLSALHTYSSATAAQARKEVCCSGYQSRPGSQKAWARVLWLPS